MRFASAERRSTSTLLWGGLVILAWLVLATLMGSSEASASEFTQPASASTFAAKAGDSAPAAHRSPAKAPSNSAPHANGKAKAHAQKAKAKNRARNSHGKSIVESRGKAHATGKPAHAAKPAHATRPAHAGKPAHAAKPAHAGKPAHAASGSLSRAHAARASVANAPVTRAATVAPAPAVKTALVAQAAATDRTHGAPESDHELSQQPAPDASDFDDPVRNGKTSERAASGGSALSFAQLSADVSTGRPDPANLMLDAIGHADAHPLAGPAATADCAPD